MKFDYYYSPIIAEKAKQEREKESVTSDVGKSLIFYYLDILGRQEYQSKNYDNTISEESIVRQTLTEPGDMDVASQFLEDTDAGDDRDLTQDLFYFWGAGFEPDEYLTLQEEYEDWMTRYIVDSKAREQLIKEACKTKILMNRALKEGNTEQYSKLSDLWKKNMDAAELSPRAERVAAKETEIPLGVMVQRFEKERPIGQPDPEWEDVDGIMKLILVYFIGHLSAMCGVKNRYATMYHEEMDKYRAKEPELSDTEDDEDVFDYVFSEGVEEAIHRGEDDG